MPKAELAVLPEFFNREYFPQYRDYKYMDYAETDNGYTQTRIKQGGQVQAAMIINRVQPMYPPLARQTRISGTVRLHAIIGKDGSVQQLEVISGHPLLVQSALDAVRQWKYRPTLLNTEPVEVDTTIDVIFSLNQ